MNNTFQETVFWIPPSEPNGIITNYQVIHYIYQNNTGEMSEMLDSSTTMYLIQGLSKLTVCVCVCVYVCMCLYVHVSVCVCMCLCACACVHMSVCLSVCVHLCVYACVYVCVHTYV